MVTIRYDTLRRFEDLQQDVGGGFINNTKYTKLKWAQAHFTLVVVAHLVLNKCNNKIFELFLLVPPSEWKSGAAVENTSKHETETNSVCERHSQL